MKEIINSLKKTLKITEPKTDAKLAKILGVTKNTIVRQKRGDKTKLYGVLPMLDYLISDLSQAKLKKFLENLNINPTAKKKIFKPTQLNDNTRFIFGQINFQCFSIAQDLRAAGFDIEQEFEQAEIINWLFNLYQEYKDTWHKQSIKELEHPREGKTKLEPQTPLNEHTRWIFNKTCVWCAHLARDLRKLGHIIKTKAEDEQAVSIHWMLNLYEEHGDDWREQMYSIIDSIKQEKPLPKN